MEVYTFTYLQSMKKDWILSDKAKNLIRCISSAKSHREKKNFWNLYAYAFPTQDSGLVVSVCNKM